MKIVYKASILAVSALLTFGTSAFPVLALVPVNDNVSVYTNGLSGNAIVDTRADFTAYVTDPYSVSQIDYAYQDPVLGSVSIGSGVADSYEVLWNTTSIIDGTYDVTATPLDYSGIAGYPVHVSVRVSHSADADVTAPLVALTGPTQDQHVGGIILLKADATDASGIARVDFFTDIGTVLASLQAPYSASYDTRAMADGIHFLSADAYDTFGNRGASSAVRVFVDNTGPSSNIVTPANNDVVSGLVTISANANDVSGVSRVEFYQDSNLIGTSNTGSNSILWDTTLVLPGSHSLFVKAFDSLGNTSLSALAYVTVKDVTAPLVSITSPTNNSFVTRGATVSINASASDLAGVTRVDFYRDGSLLCSTTAAPYTCSFATAKSPGKTYKLQAFGYDAAQNRGASAVITITTK